MWRRVLAKRGRRISIHKLSYRSWRRHIAILRYFRATEKKGRPQITYDYSDFRGALVGATGIEPVTR